MSYQNQVALWVLHCFGYEKATNTRERSLRFLEEAAELVQSLNLPEEDALSIILSVYAKPPGETFQEVGGTMTTFHALCSAANIDAEEAGRAELVRCWENIEKIRQKNLTKVR